MKRKERLDLLAELGHYLREEPDADLQQTIQRAHVDNPWFTEESIRHALHAIANAFLDREKLESWISGYAFPDIPHPEKVVGLVMAGNLPLVGFQDWLGVFVSGQRAQVKLSEKDRHLLPFLVKQLGDWNFESWEYTEFLANSETLKNFDAVIATGSNNTARYFETYFAKYQHIIRRNRNGVAVLNGHESEDELHALGRDIFTYFGLGCRNVSKLYLLPGYDFERLLEALHAYRDIINHNKYKNNFDYNLTLLILNNTPYKNNGCLLLKEDSSLQARIASVHYEFYNGSDQLNAELNRRRDEIQCVVGNIELADWRILPFGQSQEPGLTDYPDGVDIMAFLQQIAR